MNKCASHVFSTAPVWSATLLAAALLTAVAGCSKDNRLPVFPVKGTVSVQGVKADNAQLLLHAVDPKSVAGLATKPMAIAGADGTFAVTTYVTGDGAPAGEYIVTVDWRNKAEGALDAGPPDKLRGRYANPMSSPLRVKVEKQPNDLPPFELQ
jgi:hypothetical protein